MSTAEPKRRGRPAGSGAGLDAVIPPQRVTAAQREAWDSDGGGEWLRTQLDKLIAKRAKAAAQAPANL